MKALRPGVVSVVIVNFRGADDTIRAVRGLRELDWPADRIQIVVVDNASGDDSAERIRAEAPGVLLVESPTNSGFAGGCNLGVASSSGEFVAFLNSDARPDAAWLSAALPAFDDEGVGAVASRVVDWEGETVDFIDAAMTWFGMGYRPGTGLPTRLRDGLRSKDVLFGTGSAFIVRRSTFDLLGGFDERYFMFFEDVDFGWRLNLSGSRFRYVPESFVFHKHHGSADRFASYKETYYLERNALFTLYKNLSAEMLDRRLPGALVLAVRRSVAKGGVDSEGYDYRQGAPDDLADDAVPRVMLSGLYAIDRFAEELDSLTAERDRIQSTRVVTDRQIWNLLGEQDAPSYGARSYRVGYEKIVEAFEPLSEPRLTRVLIITGDPIGVKLAGPAIRAWHIADELTTAGHDVVLATMESLGEVEAPFRLERITPGDNRAFERWETWTDVIIFQGAANMLFAAFETTNKIIVADIYDPMHLEQLEQARGLSPADWDEHVRYATEVMNDQLARADFFLCASERQRHLYLGQLAALGRLTPASYEADGNLRNLLDVVPFGLSETPPAHRRSAVKGVLDGIGPDDKLVLWGGGLYNWFDPKSLIRAIARISETRSDVKLFFLGVSHPHPGVPEMAIVRESRELATELGVLDTSVFFNEAWVEFADRENYLLEADLGVSTHFDHLETTFSFRTRVLDYLWAGLPLVLTEGDSFGDLAKAERLGIVVPAADVEALARAIETMLFDEDRIAEARANVARVREEFYWARTLEPLLRFMENPRRAADLAGSRSVAPVRWPGGERPHTRSRPYGLGYNARRVVYHLRNGGPLVVAGKVVRQIRRRLGR